jgi:hypothetical protein
MWALVKEIVRTIAVAQVVILPGFLIGLSIKDNVPIDQNLDGPDVACELFSVAIRLSQFGRADPQIIFG